jgi:hypothetical protein
MGGQGDLYDGIAANEGGNGATVWMASARRIDPGPCRAHVSKFNLLQLSAAINQTAS